MLNEKSISHISAQENQEVIFEVGYKRLNNKMVAITSGLMGLSYLYSQSILATICTGLFTTMVGLEGAVGYSCIRTPRSKMVALLSQNCNQKSSSVYTTYDSSRNPRIHIHLQANSSQIETIETTTFIPSITCSQGSSRLLSKAEMPHASFPISFFPTFSALYLINKASNDPLINKVNYHNWKAADIKSEIIIAALVESIIGITSLIFSSIAILYLSGRCEFRPS